MATNTTTISLDDTSLKSGDTATVTIIFPHAVLNLDPSALSASNGTLSGLQSADNGLTWTALFTPAQNVSEANNVITLDNAVTGGTGSTRSATYQVDTTAPVATITMSDTDLSVGETATVTVSFSEAVLGMEGGKVFAPNGTLSSFTTSNDGSTWTSVFTPAAGVSTFPNWIALDTSGITDLAGNAALMGPNSGYYSINTLPPPGPSATIVIDDTLLDGDDSATVTITFSEAVSGFDSSDLSVGSGTVSGLASSDGGITWQGSLTPAVDVESIGNVVSLNQAGVVGLVTGNPGTGSATSQQYAVDTRAPTAAIVVADDLIKAGETSQVTITFSEAVSGLTLGAFQATGGSLSNLVSSDGGDGKQWSATFTPLANTEATEQGITLDNTAVTDAAGNKGAGSTNSNRYTVDTIAPGATIAMSDMELTAGETSIITISFSEAVTGMGNGKVGAPGGSLSPFSSSDGGISWTAVFTPQAGLSSGMNSVSLNTIGITDLAGNGVMSTTQAGYYSINTLEPQRPTASIDIDDTLLDGDDSATVTITFSEAVSGFDSSDLSVGSGTVSGLASSDGGITWQGSLRPTAGVESTGNVISLDQAGVTAVATGHAGTGSVTSQQYAVDTKAPTATITLSDNALKAGETAQVTIAFSERVTGLTVADLTVANGSLGALSTGDQGLTWTATFTPDAGVTDATNVITLDNTGVADLAGNAGAGSTDSAEYSIDTLAPTATLSMSDMELTEGETATVTVSFSEAVLGMDASKLSAPGGTLSSFTTSNDGLTWTSVFTPTAGIVSPLNQLSLDSTGITDLSGNAMMSFSQAGYYSVNTLPPQVPTATIGIDDTLLDGDDSATVTITFSEAVSGFDSSDLSVGSGTVSGLASSDGGITWQGSLRPAAGVESTGNVISLDQAGVTAVATGRAGTGSVTSQQYAVDTKAPTATITLSDNALKAGETAQVTIAFSERVTGLTAADLTVANGSLGALSTGDQGLTWTATFTPDAGVTDATNVITLDNTGVADLAGNAGAGSTDSANYGIDTQRPTATITLSDNALKAGETAQVTIAFSERVTGLTVADLTVANGSLGALSTGDQGLTWTATFTPDAGVTDATNVITLDNAGVADLAGNAGAGSTDSANYAIDTQRPTATITLSDNALQVGETAQVTIAFSERVTGLTVADLTVANGSLGALSTGDHGFTWTATFTPDAGVTDATNVITLDNAGVADLAGNAGAGTTASVNYTVDTVIPRVPEPEPVPVVQIDGMEIQVETGIGRDGTPTQTITIPTVTASRIDKNGTAGLADIPLLTATNGRVLLEVGVPVGFALHASGSSIARGADQSIGDLIAAIQSRTTSDSQARQSMVSGGTGFLGTLDTSAPLLVHTIVVSAAGGATGMDGALVIRGAAPGSGTPHTALVIDGSALPDGSTIELQNVAFAAVIGNVRLTGGEGSQTIVGDGASQTIVLGADDDVLHGGAGNDVVGSGAGNDQIFGDEGDDIVFGGPGDDFIDGGVGHDIVQLAGAGRDDYILRVSGGKLVMTHRDGGVDGTDIVSNVEVLRFTSGGTVDVDFRDTDVASLVRLYDTAFGRNPDEAGLNYWIARSEDGVSMRDIAEAMMGSAEAQQHYGGMSNEAYVQSLYSAGLHRSGMADEVNWWSSRLDSGEISRRDVLLGFADSAEKIALVGVMDTSIEVL